MKKFVLRVSFFSAVITALLLAIILSVGAVMHKRPLFRIPENYSGLILGNSHTACGFDDQYLDGYLNLGRVTEAYMYTYIKLREIIKQNPQLKTVFIEFDNIQIEEGWINKWLYTDGHTARFLPRYQAFMSNSELSLIAQKKPLSFISLQHLYISEGLIFARNPEFTYLQKGVIGGNSRHETSHADSLMQVSPAVPLLPAEDTNLSELNLHYLRKAIEVCRENSVQVILIRLPVKEKFELWQNENAFQQIVSQQFADVPFIDLQNFPLDISDFYDLDHLNIYGSEKVSQLLNQSIQDGLLHQSNMQTFIDARMDSLRISPLENH